MRMHRREISPAEMGEIGIAIEAATKTFTKKLTGYEIRVLASELRLTVEQTKEVIKEVTDEYNKTAAAMQQ